MRGLLPVSRTPGLGVLMKLEVDHGTDDPLPENSRILNWKIPR
jgi:hypothetical protein